MKGDVWILGVRLERKTAESLEHSHSLFARKSPYEMELEGIWSLEVHRYICLIQKLENIQNN